MNSEENTSNTTDDSSNSGNQCCDCAAFFQNFQKRVTGQSKENESSGCCGTSCCGTSDGSEE